MAHSRLLKVWKAVPVCVLLAFAVLVQQRPAGAQTAAGAASAPPLDPALGITTLPLWPGGAPGAKGESAADVPTLTVFRPAHPNGTAVIVAPGGAYIRLSAGYEGREPADRLTELGVTAFVLKYRLGPTYLYPVPLEDARRAVRLVRSLAGQYGYSPDRIGMMGFSAGGHLTAITGTLPEPGKADDPDPVERESSALNFMILVYPWLNAMEPQVVDSRTGKTMINYCSVTQGLTQADCARLNPEYTPVTHVSRTTPPTILFHTTTDSTVPVATSVQFYSAMQAAGDDCELHIFGHGPHGFGPGATQTLYEWQTLLEHWMRERGWLTPPSAH